jgi:Na+-transporting methylmalonyl-CoA/oxaloacetate decarboxylase gamma subunit
MQGTNWGQAFQVFLYGFSGVFFCLLILLMGIKIFSKISIWAQETFGKKKAEEEVKIPTEYEVMKATISVEDKLPEYVFTIPDSFVEYPMIAGDKNLVDKKEKEEETD